MNSPIQFEEFSFHRDIGRLVQQPASGEAVNHRLAPQPCRLLELLIERYPEVVPREEIRLVIWPDVQIDFERSLHFCIRQIRAALNDTPGNPRFIETIPRRGYRWIAKIKSNDLPANSGSLNSALNPVPASPADRPAIHDAPEGDSGSTDQNDQNAEHHGVAETKSHVHPKFRLRRIAGIVALGAVLLVGYFLSTGFRSNPNVGVTKPLRLRVAVMSFTPAESSNGFAGNDVALRLVDQLGNDKEQFEVVGPTTTNAYEPDNLRQLVNDFTVDCIVNGKFSETDGSSRLLAEIIRAEDGVHIWVKYFDSEIPLQVIVDQIADGLKENIASGELR